jgi:3-isopropylmalate dehydrogenase
MKAKVLVLAGQGGGAEVLAEAVRVLELAATEFSHELVLEALPLDATGRVLAASKDAQALLAGPSKHEAQELTELRRALSLYATATPLRRVTPETTRRRGRALDVLVVSEHPDFSDVPVDAQVRATRMIRAGCQLARRRFGMVTHVDASSEAQASVLSGAETFKDFPDVSVRHEPLDVAARALPQGFSRYDVVVGSRACAEWLVQGALSVGASVLAANASVGDDVFGLYQATQVATDGVPDPSGAVLAAAMALRHSLNLGREAAALEHAVFGAKHAKARLESRGKRFQTAREMSELICAQLVDSLSSQAV